MTKQRIKLYNLLTDTEKKAASEKEIRNSYIDDLTVSELQDLYFILKSHQHNMFFVKQSQPGIACEELYFRAQEKEAA